MKKWRLKDLWVTQANRENIIAPLKVAKKVIKPATDSRGISTPHI